MSPANAILSTTLIVAGSQEVRIDLHLTKRERIILLFLLAYAGETVSVGQLLLVAYGVFDPLASIESVRADVEALRHKGASALGYDLIAEADGGGYRVVVPSLRAA
jgi:DNA-binding response OmpR family regulator